MSGDPDRVVHIIVEEGTFALTVAQLRFDSPNVFTRRLDREPNVPAFWFDEHDREFDSGDFSFIDAYLMGHDIVGGASTRPPATRAFAPQGPLIVTPEVWHLVMNDAIIFQLKRLQELLEALKQSWEPPIPAYPLDKGKSAFLTGPTSFRRAVQLRSVDSKPLGEIIKLENGPFPMFQFSDVILSVKTSPQVQYWIAFRQQDVRKFLKSIDGLQFRHEDKANAALQVAQYSYAASKVATVQVDHRTPHRISSFEDWLQATHDETAWKYPGHEKHNGYLMDERKGPLQLPEFCATHALGFWRKKELHICHWGLNSSPCDWDLYVTHLPGW